MGPVSVFDFLVLTFQDTTAGGRQETDAAPNSGKWTYEVKITPPPPPPPPTKELAITSLKRSPKTPEPGQTFTISVTVARVGWSGRFNGTVRCHATIGGQRARWVGSVKPGSAMCTGNIPVTAAGKTISGSIVVSEAGASATQLFNARVRTKPTLSTAEVTTAPPQPEAGSQFYYTVGVLIRTGSSAPKRITTGTVSCQATHNGAPLRRIAQQVRPARDVLCGWEIPYGTSGQTVTGSIVVRSGGATLKHTFKRRIR